jgi:transposase
MFSTVLRSLHYQIELLDREISQLEKSMEDLIKEYQGEMLTSLCSIPGIGKTQRCFLIVLTDGSSSFENSKQLFAYLGLAPTIKMSGKSVRGQSRISKREMVS